MKKLMIPGILAGLILVSCGDNDDVSDAYGSFEATEVIVAAENQGKIIELNIREGEKCSAGQEIGLIDTLQLHLQLERVLAQQAAIRTRRNSTRAQIEVQKEQKRILLREISRLEQLYQDGAATEKQLDELKGQLATLEKQIAATETNYGNIEAEINALSKEADVTRDQKRRCRLINPVDGTVLEKYTEPYEMAVPGKPLYKIASLDELILRVYISGDQLPYVSVGQDVRVLIDKNRKENQSLEGTVSWISDQAEFTPKIIQTKEERVNLVYAVKVRVPNDGLIKIGMPGEVVF